MSKKQKDPEVGKDVKRKYLVGGVYKRHLIEKQGKGKSEKTKLGRTYIAIPPETGWTGGIPEKNGWKGK